ncbi:conjugative transposon protein TraM [Pedobacter alluvionis]|uniref:Conjugative transposon TraM protein n=1 Tax=Pedobacter alluvionis TaxID=475253 RepID=A0A497XY44_9SPHI|nr:conjugative transposon protein TraM [Pedobacter alluvionis]RLJ75112.1 conjugative transposon TraM protein [Pedobacter alluvionis]TFB30216.1 conjugative transposon protein TraM [Pedobacter alluvionis]
MKDNDNNKTTVRITEGDPNKVPEPETHESDTIKKLKKPLIFVLMGIVFIGCMYLIFAPSSDGKLLEKAGLNEAVPQATEAGMQADKSKAYEADLLEQKEKEKKESLAALSDYWSADSTASSVKPASPAAALESNHNEALGSYRNIQHTLGSFYEDRDESSALRNEIKSLKAELAQKETPPSNPVANQLELMEKSYQMAAKYFPTGGSAAKIEDKPGAAGISDSGKEQKQNASFAALFPARKNIVSALYREPSDSAFLSGLSQMNTRDFYTAGEATDNDQIANSIAACIHDTQIITSDNAVRIRLLDNVRLYKMVIPKGTVLTAMAKFQPTRLQLLIQSVEFKGYIMAVELTVYDVDGQPGLAIPYSSERSALTDIAANMGNTGGTSISMSSTAGQQIKSDLSKSLVQGISGYFSKKVRMPKITLKAGYKLFLVSKK